MLEYKLIEKTPYGLTPFLILWWWNERDLPRILERKTIGKVIVDGERDDWLDTVTPNSCNVNISFYQAYELYNARVERLDMSLDDLASLRR